MIEGGADGGELEKDSYEEMFRSYLTEDLLEELQKIEQPFVCSGINEKRKTMGPELDKAVTALIKFITGTDKIGVKRIKSLCTDVLCHFDIYVISLMKLTPAIKDVSDEISVWNIFHFLRYLNIPGKKMAGNLFAVEDNPLLFYKKKLKLKRLYQEPWLELIKHELPRPLIRLLVPYLSDHALSGMRDGYLFGDFLFRVFHFGGLFAVLALSGIFKLIMDFNLFGLLLSLESLWFIS
ncbi:hypothetical protein AB6A40_002375 [Gnathostoma spinigerum]|uniref:Uncharacterized protein n=1 Tax=Gnathostoma spinigerum TaxID=75299 RepID=A0ABD6E7R9_9BILA